MLRGYILVDVSATLGSRFAISMAFLGIEGLGRLGSPVLDC